MKAIYRLAWLLLFVALMASSAIAGEILSGKVIGISDGDTITVLAAGNRQVKIRLYGIDCPESRQAFGRRAKEATSRLIFGQNAHVEVINKDRYGRTVGIVYDQDGKEINGQLVSLGLAWVYPQYCKIPICKSWKNAEMAARASGRGLWADKDPLPPWDWRKIRKKIR